MTNGKPSICFVSLDNFAVLMDDLRYGQIGGAEMQQAIIGRNLVARGYKVSFITLDHGQPCDAEIDGMRIFKAYRQDAGVRRLRFLHPRLTGLWRAMRQADADIYYQRTHDSTTGVVAAFCRRHGRKFVFAAAHDYDCVRHPPRVAQHAHLLYRYGLRRASVVIAQTATQQRLFRESFRVQSEVIANCAPDYGCPADGVDARTLGRERRLLWVGVFKPVKRLEMLLDTAEQLQEFRFDVVGGNGDSEYVQSLRLRARCMRNVHLHGLVRHADVHRFYQRAAALVCTSRAEGFPNTFLEAWSHGLPVVSTFDPDQLIAQNGIGIVAQDRQGLISGIRVLLADDQRWQQASRAARQYYVDNHAVDSVMAKFERVFQESMSWSSRVGSENERVGICQS